MEYIGFGKDDVEYDEEPEDGLRETETVPEERKKSTERRVLSTGNVVSLPGVNCGKMIVYRPVSYEDTKHHRQSEGQKARHREHGADRS